MTTPPHILASLGTHRLQDPSLRRVHVRTTMPIKMDHERPEYYRSILTWAPPAPGPAGAAAGAAGAGCSDSTAWAACEGELHAASTGGQISSRLLSLRSANALLEIPQVMGMDLPGWCGVGCGHRRITGLLE